MISLDDSAPAMPASAELAELVKSNRAILDAIDKDPELRAQYLKDSAELADMKVMQEELFTMLFDAHQGQIRDDGKDRWVDIVNQRAIPYRYLERAGKTEVPRMIKNLRRYQLTEFSHAASSKRMGNEKGLALVWKDPHFEPKEEQKRELSMWEQRFVERFFFPAGDDTPNLAKFLGTMYEDWFNFDDITLQIIRDPLHQPIAMTLADPSLWFPTASKITSYPRIDDDFMFDPDRNNDFAGAIVPPKHDYIMIQGNKKITAATRDVVYKSHFFARSDYKAWKRGYSIMEQGLNVTTILINAFTYNASNFSNDRFPVGFFALSGGFTNRMQLEAVKKIIWASMSGAANQRKIPIIGLPDNGKAEFVHAKSNNRDMEFHVAMTLFSSVMYALSGTNPNLSGLSSFKDAMKGNRFSEPSEDGIWRQTNDPGLITFLGHVEKTLNVPMTSGRNVFEEVTGLPIRAVFKGLAAEDLKAKYDLIKARLATTHSINEVRKEEGMEATEIGFGDENIADIPGASDSTISGYIRANAQQQAAKEAQEQAAAAQPQPGKPQLGERDKQLIDQYGEPEQ